MFKHILPTLQKNQTYSLGCKKLTDNIGLKSNNYK